MQTVEPHLAAVKVIVTALADRTNWYLDLANERNLEDTHFVPFDELRLLRDAAKEMRPELLVTASHSGDLTHEDVAGYLETAGLDFLAVHRPRTRQSPGETAQRCREATAWAAELGRGRRCIIRNRFGAASASGSRKRTII